MHKNSGPTPEGITSIQEGHSSCLESQPSEGILDASHMAVSRTTLL